MKWIQADYGRIDIDVKWSKAVALAEAYKSKENGNLYKLIGLSRDGNYQLVYFGRCIKQKFTKRIFQRDHLSKQADFLAKNKKMKLLVCLGNITEEKKRKPKMISDIESLLIHSHSDERFPYLVNKQCTLSHNVIKNYLITNKGWRKEKSYKAVGYGLFMAVI
jgi:hypothetical protein